MAAMKMSQFLPKKAHSARNNDAFTHCGISLISPNTLHQKYSGSLKKIMFWFNFYFIRKRHPLWSNFQENDPYMKHYKKTQPNSELHISLYSSPCTASTCTTTPTSHNPSLPSLSPSLCPPPIPPKIISQLVKTSAAHKIKKSL